MVSLLSTSLSLHSQSTMFSSFFHPLSPQIVKERMLCHAIIGRSGGKELIMKVQINCEFITPLLEVDSNHLDFRVDKPPTEELFRPCKPIALTNVSSLPLTANLSLPFPFQMLEKEDRKQEMVCKII